MDIEQERRHFSEVFFDSHGNPILRLPALAGKSARQRGERYQMTPIVFVLTMYNPA